MNREVLELAKGVEKRVVAWRRDFHRHPEPGFEEKRTGDIIARELRSFGLDVKRMAKTGVAATLRAGKGKAIAFRADMDALRMTEETGLPFASRNPGAAHMCGHDAHMAMLLGAAAVLARIKDRLARPVRFVFQPSEEAAPGGAEAMVKEGVLKGVEEIFALHVDPELPTGRFGGRAGPALAAADGVSINVIGKGGHGAAPHLAIDPVTVAAEIVVALQQVVSRNVNPIDAAVVSICNIHGGTAWNVIPESVLLRGTVRTLKESIRRKMPRRIERIARSIAHAHGAKCEFHYQFGYPPLFNHPSSVEKVKKAVKDLLGKSLAEITPRMGAEDFSYYLHKVKGAIIHLGVGRKKGGSGALHNPRFILDEAAMPLGVAFFVQLALM